jgi:hypothetical protein
LISNYIATRRVAGLLLSLEESSAKNRTDYKAWVMWLLGDLGGFCGPPGRAPRFATGSLRFAKSPNGHPFLWADGGWAICRW